MNYTFYKIDDTETGIRNSGVFEANEKYYIDEDDVRVDNEAYTADGASAYELDRDRRNVKYSGNPSRLYDPTDAIYDYKEARTKGPLGYKSLGEQLDMQYWDNTNGTTTWGDHIQAVKTAYPKPS